MEEEKGGKKVVLIFKDPAADELPKRARGQIDTGRPSHLTGLEGSVHFLRGALSRATICLPAFYQFLGAASVSDEALRSADSAFRVNQSYAEFANLSVITLSCRKLFDQSAKDALTGGRFGKISDATLYLHAKYWAKHSLRSEEDAWAALRFLRRIFSDCSKNDTELLKAEGQLQKRIGLLKQYANRAAAHLSAQDFSVDIVDVVHFVTVCTVLGEVIRQFDAAYLGEGYFKDLDKASYLAAQRTFPAIPEFLLFGSWNIHKQAEFYWRHEDLGLDHLYNGVQNAVGAWPHGAKGF
ncbi:MAG TPA: hypothetical protein VJ806_15235 [Luteimonas sp.]|nr:hypothetical protein [Luteimonas sp.]